MSSITAVRGGARAVLARGYRAIRNLPDRLLHGRRHSTMRARLSNAQRPRRVLVVCYGNICRSPYLQAVLQRALPDIAVSSAGFFGSDRGAPRIALDLGAERGVDLSRHRSRPVNQATVRQADIVIVMDSEQARQLVRLYGVNRGRIIIAGDLDPMFETRRAILDPWNQPIEAFRSSFDRLDRCAATLVTVWRAAE